MTLPYYIHGQMGFHDLAIFPERISKGSTGAPRWNTGVVRRDGGSESRIPRWAEPLLRFDAREGVRKQQDISALITFFRARIGATYGFRFKNWWDYATTTTATTHNPGDAAISHTDVQTIRVSDGMPGVGNALETQFQLVKRYSDGGVERVRTIEKPDGSSLLVGVDGSLQGSGYVLDDATGIVTFAAAPAVGEDVTAGFLYFTPCRLSEETDLDGLVVQAVDFDSNSMPSILIDEIRGNLAIPEEANYGGSKNWRQVTGDVQLSLSSGRAHLIEPAVPGLAALLPAAESMADGVGHFFIRNEAASETLAVKSEAVTLVTIPAQNGVEIGLAKDNNGVFQWMSFG